MNKEAIVELVTQLLALSRRYQNGFKNIAAIDQMEPLLTHLEAECSSTAYLAEKAASARHNFGLMFSERRHLSYGGPEAVARRFSESLGLITTWIDRHAGED